MISQFQVLDVVVNKPFKDRLQPVSYTHLLCASNRVSHGCVSKQASVIHFYCVSAHHVVLAIFVDNVFLVYLFQCCEFHQLLCCQICLTKRKHAKCCTNQLGKFYFVYQFWGRVTNQRLFQRWQMSLLLSLYILLILLLFSTLHLSQRFVCDPIF